MMKMSGNGKCKAVVIFLSFLMVSLLAVNTGFAMSHGGSEDTKDTQMNVQEKINDIKEYSVEQKDAAVARAEELMEDIDDQMHVWEGRLEEKWDNMKESSKENYKASKENLQEQREELSAWLDKMQNSSADAWGEMKNGFSSAYDSFVETWKETEKKVDEEM